MMSSTAQYKPYPICPCSSLTTGGVPASGGAMAAALLISPTRLPPKSHGLLFRFRHLQSPSSPVLPGRSCLRIHALQESKEETATSSPAEEITEKYGLEFGLWKIFSSKDGGREGKGTEGEGKEKSRTDQAKELLAKYGGAYLATSITLSLISFTLCYLLVSAGIDVQALLAKVGIATDETGGKVGTFALAYAAHKAASPIRFPPTVALTPIVASWIGKKRTKTDN